MLCVPVCHSVPVHTPASFASSLARQSSTGVSIGGSDSFMECQTPQPNHALQRMVSPRLGLFGSAFIQVSFHLIDRLPSPSLSLGR